MPRATYRRRGSTGDNDYKPVHLGTHDAVARAVQTGQVPAGALSKPIYRACGAQDHRRRASCIGLTAPIPNYPIVMQGNLAPQLKQAIRAAFLKVKDKSAQDRSASRASPRPTTRRTTCCAIPPRCSKLELAKIDDDA